MLRLFGIWIPWGRPGSELSPLNPKEEALVDEEVVVSNRDSGMPPCVPELRAIEVFPEKNKLKLNKINFSNYSWKNYETYHRSTRVQLLTSSEQFWIILKYFEPYLWLSQIISDYLGLSWTILDYFGLSRTNLDYLGLSRTISDYLGLSRTISDYFGQFRTISD